MWYWTDTNLLCYSIVRSQNMVQNIGGAGFCVPQILWKGKASGTRGEHFLWIAVFQEHPGKQRLPKLWAKWQLSGFWTIGFASTWWEFVCQKNILLRKIKVNQQVWTTFFFFFPPFLLRAISTFEHLSMTWSRIWKCWKLLKYLHCNFSHCGVKIITAKNANCSFVVFH